MYPTEHYKNTKLIIRHLIILLRLQQHNTDSQNSNHLSVHQEHATLHNNIVNFRVYISAWRWS
jgi:hypothetical protein